MTGIGKRLKAEMKDPVSLLLFIPDESVISTELIALVKDLAAYSDNIDFEIEKTGKEWNERMKDLKSNTLPVLSSSRMISRESDISDCPQITRYHRLSMHW